MCKNIFKNAVKKLPFIVCTWSQEMYENKKMVEC